MKNAQLVVFFLAAAAVGGVYAWVRVRAEFGPPPVAYTIPVVTEKHTVTTSMSESSQTMVDVSAPPFQGVALDGSSWALKSSAAKGPVVLTFIKYGCPCSDEAQPFFNALAAAFPGAQFLGLIDVNDDRARDWASRQGVKYPIVFDKDLKVVHDYKVENSTYTILIDRDGTIRQHWPGFSMGMLRSVEQWLVEQTRTHPAAIDVEKAPEDLYSGCPF